MKVAVILRKPPYGEVQAAEAVRHALGAVGFEIDVNLILLDGGVLLAKKGQLEGESGYTNLGAGLQDLIGMGGGVFADKKSLKKFGLNEGDLIDNLQIVNSKKISETIKSADQMLVF